METKRINGVATYTTMREDEHLVKAYHIIKGFRRAVEISSAKDNFDIVSATTGEVIEYKDIDTALRVLSAVIDNSIWEIDD